MNSILCNTQLAPASGMTVIVGVGLSQTLRNYYYEWIRYYYFD